MSQDTVNVFLSGVGGQGLVLVNRLLARAAILSGLDAKSTDTHGLAMRGGAVIGTLRMGATVPTSLFPPGKGHLLLGLEPLEALRHVHMMAPGATVVTSTDELWPSPILLEKAPMPADWRDQLRDRGLKVVELSGVALSVAAGDYRMLNVVLAGAASPFLPLDFTKLQEATKTQVPKGTEDHNLQALELGRQATAGQAKA